MSREAGGAPTRGSTPRAGRRTGRRPGSDDTRGRILAAARAAFADHGFGGATVRDVASRAGVDPALVHHYFGSKQRLFVAAMEFPVDVAAVIPRLVRGPREGLGERFLRFIVETWDRPEVRQMILGVVRSASTDPTAAAMMRGVLAEGPLLALAGAIDLPDARLRASLAGSQLIGIAMARYVVGIEPFATLTPAELAAAMGPVFEHYLTAGLGIAAGGDASDRAGGPPPR